MADRDKIIAERLKKERESLSYKLKDVAQKMGFENHQVLGNIESGKRPLKASELVQLSGLYGRNIDFFLREQSQAPRVLWRDPAKTEETIMAERKFIEICQGYRKLLSLTQEGRNTDYSFPILCAPNKQAILQRGFQYVAELAEQTRKMLDLGARPAHSLADVLEGSLGVLVVHWDLKTAGSAASLSSDDCRAVVINSSNAPWRRNYDLAHELFHLITWDLFTEEEISAPPERGTKNYVEQLANAFASVLLLPEEEVRNEFQKRVANKTITYISLIEIAREFRVSTEALLWRLTNLMLLKQKDVEKWLTEGTIRDVDRQVRCEDRNWDTTPYLSARYVALAIKAYFMGKISRARFAEYINIPFSSIADFLARNGYNDDGDYSVVFPTHS
jgi:Zn-dependent peptidase ImmA (M78 family)/transcriptional regulator with XRE-family HTH domain